VSQSEVPAETVQLLAELGLFLSKIGMLPEAAMLGRGVSELRPAAAQGPLLEGYVAFAAGRTADAEKHYRTAVARAPEDATVRTFLAESLLAQRRFREAEDLLAKASTSGDAGGRMAKELLDAVRQGLFAAR
jgi:Flp pilus assembly protein TadD